MTGGQIPRSERFALRIQEKGIRPEHPRIAPFHEAGDRDHAEGQPRHRVEGAHVDGAAFLGLEGQPLPLEARLEDLLHLGPRRAGGHRPEAAEVVDHLEDRVAIALGADPLVDDGAQPLDPLRPGRLAGEAVERPADELHDAQQRLRVDHVALPSLASLGVLLRLPGLALGLSPRAQAEDPAAEAGDDPGLAARLVPARGARRHVGAEELGERHGREGQELHDRRPLQPAAAEEEQQRARRAAEAQGQRGVQAVRNAEAGEKVREERGVGLGPREDDAHVLEAHAAGRLAQQLSGDRPHLGRLAGCGDEKDRAVVRLEPAPAALLEEPLAQASERRRRGGRGEGRERRVAPVDLRHAPRGEPAAEGRGTQGRRERAAQHAHGQRRGEGGHELDLDHVELQVVGDQHLGSLEPPRAREPLARRGEERRGVGGAALERAVEVAVEALERGEAPGVVGSRRRPRDERGEPLRRDPAPAQRGEGSSQGGGHRRARRSLGEAQAGLAALREEPRGQERVVAARPGDEALAEEDRLGQRAREVERLHRVDAGEGTAGRGEAPRQLDGGGEGRREEDEGAQGHAARRF